MVEGHSAGIAPAVENEIAPASRGTPPSAAASSGAAPKRLHQIELRKYSAVEARIFLPMASAARYPAIQTRRGRSNTITSWVVNHSVAMPRGIGVCFEVCMGVSRSQDWRSMHLKPGCPR